MAICLLWHVGFLYKDMPWADRDKLSRSPPGNVETETTRFWWSAQSRTHEWHAANSAQQKCGEQPASLHVAHVTHTESSWLTWAACRFY